MTELVVENRLFMKQLGIDKCTDLKKLLELGRRSNIKRFVVGYTPSFVSKLQNYDVDEHLIVINAEPDTMGASSVKHIINLLSEHSNRITFFTANRDLDGISDSIIPLTFEQLDRLRSPRSKCEWKFQVNNKVKNISMVYSAKTYTTGHVIRKYIYEKYKNSGLIDFFMAKKGDNTTHLENRKNSLENYRYNLIIENTFDEYHISDQLKDSFLGKCIPIYLGNASKYSKLYEDEWGIDWNGVIEIKSEGLENILKRVNEIEYRQRTSIIERNANNEKR